jgi:hypothetical protein
MAHLFDPLEGLLGLYNLGSPSGLFCLADNDCLITLRAMD